MCLNCHEGETPADYRLSEADFDGDGDTAEGLAGEIETLAEYLYAAIQAYAADHPDAAAIVYESHSYPYFFTDTNEDGVATPDEANYGNRYATFTPVLQQAAYNYQYALKDPGAYAHNGKYVIQVLYDTLDALDWDMTGLVRP